MRTTEDGRPFAWIVDNDWRVPSEYGRCRMRISKARSPFRLCPNAPVADMARRRWTRNGNVVSWWAYCEEHLYGRRLRDGKIEVAVHPDSPAAREGSIGRKAGR